MRELLLYHWHCILPAVGVLAALVFMRDKDSDGKQEKKGRAGRQEDDGKSE